MCISENVKLVFESADTDPIVLVDASNAFNALNREVALRNVLRLCPSIAKVLINTYRGNGDLYIDGEVLSSQEGTTQGDPLAMVMYAIAVIPLLHRLSEHQAKQVWYADDATAGGQLSPLRDWWDDLRKIGPEYGYHPNASKTWLIVKEGKMEAASAVFKETGINITSEGRRHLGAALGTRSFAEVYVKEKVTDWVKEIEQLSSIAVTHPHAAYAALTHGLSSKWTFVARTIPEIGDLLGPLEDALRHRFLTALTGRTAICDSERDLMALPVRLGGMGICNPTKQAIYQHSTSEQITAPLVALILLQSHALPAELLNTQKQARSEARKARHQLQVVERDRLQDCLPASMRRALEVSSEKGASSWLSTLPILEHGFALHKGAFRDALCLRYGWRPLGLPSVCVCGKSFSVEHALSCPRGGLPSVRHNELRDITAQCFTEVCHGVGIEPGLQPLTQETLIHSTANSEDGARLDVVADGFWGGSRQRAFFDVRVFNPFAQSHCKSTLAKCYRRNEQEKKRAYDQRIREVEHGSFSPLVFSSSGGMGPTATTVYRRLAAMIAEKRKEPFSRTLFWLRCRLNFSLLRSAVSCLRGARSSLGRPASCEAIDLAIEEGRVPLY